MTLSDISIRRPVLTWVMMAGLVVFGVMGYSRLGVDHFPVMDFPVVMVSAVLEGAHPEAIEEDVTDVIEEQVATIAGIRRLYSTSAPGRSSIVVEFELGTDLDIAIQDVRDKLAQARYRLPTDLDPPIVSKGNQGGGGTVMWTPIRTDRSLIQASEYVRRVVRPVLETIPGVASLSSFGPQERAIRIWLDGEALRARGLAATDVLAALGREHIEVPGGFLQGDVMEYSVKTDAEFASVEALAGLVVASLDGATVRLSDVARVEDGAQDLVNIARYDGVRTIGVGINKQSGANAVAIADAARARFEEINAILPPGTDIATGDRPIDLSASVREAVKETQFALVFGALLAVVTVFVFLRRWRPTLIVAAAIPLSLVASFGFTWAFGFTLNTMTLLAMALAVGVVIDDAIVVLENIERHRDAGADSFEAASGGTREIAFAATAATLSITIVFVPAFFVEGILGSFLGEFGVTVASAVMISLFVALTLTPMLAARIPPAPEREHGGIYHRLERGFGAIEAAYRAALHWTLAHRPATFGIAVASLLLSAAFFWGLGVEMMPPSDQGIFISRIETPPGTTLEHTEELLAIGERWWLQQPEVAGMFASVGGGGGRSGTNQGMLVGTLLPKNERARSIQELIRDSRQALRNVPGVKFRTFDMSGMGPSGQGARFSVDVRGNVSLAELDRLSEALIRRLEADGRFLDLDKSLKLGLPELRVTPDRDRAAALGVDAATLARTVRAMIGGVTVGSFKDAGRRYDIIVRLEEEARRDPSAIGRLYVRGRDGQVVELRNLVGIETGAAPSAITRQNRRRSVRLGGDLAQGFALGDAVAAARAHAAEVLPEGVTLELAGDAEQMQESVRQFGLALGLAVLMIYLVLAAQFESFVHPFTVMFALLFAGVGAFGGLLVTGQTLNMFSGIGLLILCGLVTKNSILLVDRANQLRAEGVDKVEAMRRAAPVRMRPVLMTAVSMIFGVLPAAVGFGPGAETRQPLAIATACGMFSSTLLTLLIVPVFYIGIDNFAEAFKRGVRRLVGLEPAGAGSAARG